MSEELFTAKEQPWAGVHGTTLIDHRIRNQLQLTCDEYVYLQFVYNWNKENGAISFYDHDLWRAIGKRNTDAEANSTYKKGFIIPTIGTSHCNTSDKWNIHFDQSLEFDEFWTLYRKWGNKADTKRKYEKCRKIASKEQIFKGVKAYLQFKEGTEQQYIMKAETWLNPEKRHWEDEYRLSQPQTQVHIRPKK